MLTAESQIDNTGSNSLSQTLLEDTPNRVLTLLSSRNKKATICRSFCDSIYEHCADAMFGSKTIKEIFVDKNLQDGGFCKDNFFDVVDGEKDCYKFDPRPFSDTNRLNSNTLLITLISGVHLLTTAAMRYQNTSP